MEPTQFPERLTINTIHRWFISGEFNPRSLVKKLLERIREDKSKAVWIYLLSDNELEQQFQKLEDKLTEFEGPVDLKLVLQKYPLFGIPFAVKDNIDIESLPTSAGCPEFTYKAKQTATAVQLLYSAGALLLGKTNLDQFACGLVGVRSPFGAPACAFDRRFIAGGSSSGSALAVSTQLAAFSLGTDTAGSGRVPAAFNNIVGLKPTNGIVSTHGVVPACRSVDCVSVFANSVADAYKVLGVMARFDPKDCYAQRFANPLDTIPEVYFLSAEQVRQEPRLMVFKFAVPDPEHLDFMGELDSRLRFQAAVEQLQKMGGLLIDDVDFKPFAELGKLLYEGPYVVERFLAIKDFFRTTADSIVPVTRCILEKHKQFSGADVFEAMYKVKQLRRQIETIFTRIDVLVVPTVPRHFTLEEESTDPIEVTKSLATYGAFANLARLTALAVPNGFTEPASAKGARLPIGVTFLAPSFKDSFLARLGHIFMVETDSANFCAK